MKKLVFLLTLVACLPVFAQNKPQPKTIYEVMDNRFARAEKDFVSAAEAMPADKFDFAPGAAMGEFKGVRTFALEIRHVSTINYLCAASILGEKPPVEMGTNENGPDTLKTRDDVIKYMKDSFAYAHKALKSLNDQNVMESVPFTTNSTSRANLATIMVAHPWDHYGQMVEYLRMNGIVPPASRE
jgi:uncharacterized damage-inducible protein DinB